MSKDNPLDAVYFDSGVERAADNAEATREAQAIANEQAARVFVLNDRKYPHGWFLDWEVIDEQATLPCSPEDMGELLHLFHTNPQSPEIARLGAALAEQCIDDAIRIECAERFLGEDE